MEYSPIDTLHSIEGAISELASTSPHPQGYPLKQVDIYLTDGTILLGEIENPITSLRIHSASDLENMKVLNFKDVGKILGSKTQEAKRKILEAEKTEHGWRLLGEDLPESAICIATKIPPTSNPMARVCANGQAMVVADFGESEEHWVSIQFSKAVKLYVTETLRWRYLPEIFKVARLHDEDGEEQDTLYVDVEFVDGKEDVYQALHTFKPFKGLPFRFTLPDRQTIARAEKEPNCEVFGCKLLIGSKPCKQQRKR